MVICRIPTVIRRIPWSFGLEWFSLDRTQCRKPELVFVIEFMPMQFEFVILQRMTGVIVAQDFEDEIICFDGYVSGRHPCVSSLNRSRAALMPDANGCGLPPGLFNEENGDIIDAIISEVERLLPSHLPATLVPGTCSDENVANSTPSFDSTMLQMLMEQLCFEDDDSRSGSQYSEFGDDNISDASPESQTGPRVRETFGQNQRRTGCAKEPMQESRRRMRDVFPLPLIELPTVTPRPRRQCRRNKTRAKRLFRAIMSTNRTILAVNQLYGNPLPRAYTNQRRIYDAGQRAHPRAAFLIKYIFDCAYQFSYITGEPPSSAAALQVNDHSKQISQSYSECVLGGPIEVVAEKVALPEVGGGFDACSYAPPDLAAFGYAEEAAMEDGFMAQLASVGIHSFHKASPDEYAAVLCRLAKAGMIEFTDERCEHPLGLFSVPKDEDTQRLITDGRPANVFFRTPVFEHTSGDSLGKMQVPHGKLLEVAKADLENFFHTCDAPPPCRQYLGLRPVQAATLVQRGAYLQPGVVDADGFTHPRYLTLPMGWGPSPGIAQSAHEAILYGGHGIGSDRAQALEPVLSPAARWSSKRVPNIDSTYSGVPHALVVDDLMLFRYREKLVQDLAGDVSDVGRTSTDTAIALQTSGKTQLSAPELGPVLKRYKDVGLRAKASKVFDYSPVQDLLGYKLDHNVLRCSESRYQQLRTAVLQISQRGWVYPREVEGLVGRFTHVFLLCRFALSIFSAVYAFARKCGHLHTRPWPSVIKELTQALDILPLIRSDLGRPVSPLVVQTDACNTGEACVYTETVAMNELKRECLRPRHEPSASEVEVNRWSVQAAYSPLFPTSTQASDWRIGFRRAYSTQRKLAHINDKEMGALTNAVRWASRAPRSRNCRICLQSDSAVAVAVARKGRSSRPGMLKHCRRLAAVTLTEQIALEARWVATSKNMADRPSRGDTCPGPCED
jgi:hypothetical protein